ncbi:hypothetical protein DFH29DRAFT_1005335 [Suillus ampliporus]|nr:hypothetical protein DFH29DRAFT_1005335 [Suillus ampliporus]
MGIDIGKGTHSSIIAQRKTKMPAAQWTTKEQYEWLQEQLPEYIALHGKDKDYTHFWAKTHLYWFKRWPEQAALFPDIPIEITLTDQQQAAELAAEKTHKVKNRGLKKEISIFETALLPKSRTKFIEEIYMDMVYDERIKPLVKAGQEVGNIATAGCRMALGQKFCKELLEDESDEVKQEVREKYNKQKKVKKDMLDDKANNNNETDADAIAKYRRSTNHMPALCMPHQEKDLIYSLLHMRWTRPEAELVYHYFIAHCKTRPSAPNKRNPLLPDVGDDDETNELEGCNNGEEPKDAEEHAEDGEENDKGQHGDSIDWDNLGFASSSTGISDASPLGELNQSAFYSETQAQFDALFGQAQPDASFRQTQPDASFGQTQSDALFGQTQPDALFGQAQPDASLEHAWHNTATMLPNPISMLQSSVPGTIEALRLSFSHADVMTIGYFGSDNTMQNSFPPAFSSSAPSFTDTGNTIGGRYDTQYDMHTWNLTNSDSQGSPNEGTQDLADTHAGADLAKSKHKFKSKPPAAKVKCNSTIAPTNTAKPKAKLKERPVAKSGVITETSHAAADEGNTLVHSTTINTTTTKQNPVAQRASNQIPIKSKQNDVADTIGSDGLTDIHWHW